MLNTQLEKMSKKIKKVVDIKHLICYINGATEKNSCKKMSKLKCQKKIKKVVDT